MSRYCGEEAYKGDSGLGIEDGGVVVAVHVGGDNLVLSVGENTLEGSLSGVLDGLLDGLVRGGLLEADGKVDDGDVLGGHTHGHSGELAVELGDDLSDGL